MAITTYTGNVAVIVALSVFSTFINANPRISATAPMPSVDEGGVLAIHCRVWNLQSNHEVTILRTLSDNHVERLSLQDGLVSGTSDRVFLAVRQLDDASNVYFLSIIDVTRQDQGEYTCYIVSNVDGFTQVATDSVHVSVLYFPSDLSPNCNSNDENPVTEGSMVTFNCSSAIANPPVSMKWSQTGTDKLMKTVEEIHGDTKFTSMSMIVMLQDHGSVFLCTISSELFPGEIRTCHIGPLNVVLVHDSSREIPSSMIDIEGDTKPTSASTGITIYSGDANDQKRREYCKKTCSSTLSSSAFFWIVATVVSAIFAVVFCIIGIILFVKFYRSSKVSKTKYTAARLVSEEIYSELENRRLSSKFYMTLVKPDNAKNTFIPDKRGVSCNIKPNTRSFNA